MNRFNHIVDRKKTGSCKWDLQQNKESLPFWIADSDYQTSPTLIKDLVKRVKHGIFGYGFDEKAFKEAIKNWYKDIYKADLLLEDIIPTNGVLSSIRFILEAFTNQDEQVIIQTPVYHCFFRVINSARRRVVENCLIKLVDEETKTITCHMDYAKLEELFKQGIKTMILCSPHNPVGRCWTKKELDQLVMLVNKYDVNLICDEIHSDLMIDGTLFNTCATYLNDVKHLFICNAPSKAFNIAGMDTSYVIVRNKNDREKLVNTLSAYFIPSPNIMGAYALISAYTKGHGFIQKQNEFLTSNYHLFKRVMRNALPKAYITKLEATYLVFVDLSYLHKSSKELVDYFALNHLTFNNGAEFGSCADGCIRINLACPRYQLTCGLNMLIEAVKELENAA